MNDKSLAQPLGIAVSSNGKTLYVAAFGSSKVGVFDTAALESDSFAPTARLEDRVRSEGRDRREVIARLVLR